MTKTLIEIFLWAKNRIAHVINTSYSIKGEYINARVVFVVARAIPLSALYPGKYKVEPGGIQYECPILSYLR